jgi:hypothetical protein
MTRVSGFTIKSGSFKSDKSGTRCNACPLTYLSKRVLQNKFLKEDSYESG